MKKIERANALAVCVATLIGLTGCFNAEMTFEQISPSSVTTNQPTNANPRPTGTNFTRRSAGRRVTSTGVESGIEGYVKVGTLGIQTTSADRAIQLRHARIKW